MARDISGGFLLVTERTFHRFSPADLNKLGFELERMLKEVRGQQPDLNDMAAIQARNRKLQRLNSARTMLRAYRTRRR